jgi:CspA family cold shock protein
VTHYEQIVLLFRGAYPLFEVGERRQPTDGDGTDDWTTLWAAVAEQMLRHLEGGRLAEFEAAFAVVREALRSCGPVGRQAAVRVLFGDFTRRSIAANFDRTRFAEWFEPAELFAPSNGRLQRGRVLYFNPAKGRGKILGASGLIFFVHFSAIQDKGFRSLESGELVEFSSIDGPRGLEARDVARLTEAGYRRGDEDTD